MAIGSGGASSGASGSIRAGRAHVEMSAKDAGLSKALDAIAKRAKTFGKTVAASGAALLGIGGTGLGTIGKAFGDFISNASGLQRLASKLGVGTAELSSFAYAASTTGMSLEDLTGQFENLAERVAQGAEGSGEAAETFKKLGIDAAQLKLQNPVDQMITLAEAMQGVTNETERLGMLSSLGGDQFQWMNVLFKQGGGGIRKLMQEAGSVGAVLKDETAADAVKAAQAITRATTALRNAFLAVGAAILPQVEMIEKVSALVVKVVGDIRQFIDENQSLVLGIAAGSAALIAFGSALLVTGLGITAAVILAGSLVAGIVAIKAAFVAALPAMIAVGVATAAVALIFHSLSGYAEKFGLITAAVEGIGQAWESLRETVGLSFEGIKAALSIGDFSAAFKIAVASLNVVWQQFVLGLELAWAGFKDIFVDGWDTVTAEIALLWVDLGYQIRSIFDSLGRWIDQTFSDVIGAVARKLGAIVEKVASQRLVRDAVGLNATKQLKELAQQLKATSNPTLFQSDQKQLDAEVNATRQAIRDDLARSLAERHQARFNDVNGQNGVVAQAKRDLEMLVDAAKFKAAIQKATEASLALAQMGMATVFAQEKASIQSAISAGTRGGFDVSRAAEQFGSGGAVQDKIEKNTRDARDLLKDLVDIIPGIRSEYA